MWTNAPFPPSSLAMKPKPLSTLNHFTVPVSSTDVSEDGPPDVGDRTLALRDVTGAAVLVSTLSTSVTCGPLCPGPTRTSRVSPGCTALMLL